MYTNKSLINRCLQAFCIRCVYIIFVEIQKLSFVINEMCATNGVRMVYSRIWALKTPPNRAGIGEIIAPIGLKEEILTGGAARCERWATHDNNGQQKTTIDNKPLQKMTPWRGDRQQMITVHYT